MDIAEYIDKLEKQNRLFRKKLSNIEVLVFQGCVDEVKADGKPISYTVKDLDS